MTTYKIQRAKDQEDLARLASQLIASNISLALEQRDRVQIALSGGSTPEQTYLLLGKEHLPWDRVDVFLGDERWVDSSSDLSNALMIRRSLLLSTYPGANAKFHTFPTTQLSTPHKSAEAFAELVSNKCGGDPPIFDLILLGLGNDGHTASLFPDSESLNIKDRWTAVCSGNGQSRVTLTAPVLSSARKIFFLVSGRSKQIALKKLLDPSETSSSIPAKLVNPRSEIIILADDEASALIC